jgi:hypothetical protein
MEFVPRYMTTVILLQQHLILPIVGALQSIAKYSLVLFYNHLKAKEPIGLKSKRS